METTIKGDALTGKNMPEQYLPINSVPSVVLAGKYTINGVSGKTFYTYQKSGKTPVFYCANKGEIAGLDVTMLDRFISSQSIVMTKDASGNYTAVRTLSRDQADFEVAHPDADVRGVQKVGGDVVTLQVKSLNSGYWFWDPERKEHRQISDRDAQIAVNKLLFQNLGGAHCYTEGMAFFTAPIQHWGWYRADNKNRTENRPFAEWKWDEMKTGDFGIVRNHVYTMEISKIAGLGTGVIDEDDPVLPPSDNVGYAVNFRVNIQKWATLPTQKWEW